MNVLVQKRMNVLVQKKMNELVKKEWMWWSKKLQATLSAEGQCSTFDHQEHWSVATFFLVSFLSHWVAFLSNQSVFCRIRWFSWVINSSGFLSNLSNQFSCFTTPLIHIFFLDLWILQKTGATAIEKMRKLNQTMHCNTVQCPCQSALSKGGDT